MMFYSTSLNNDMFMVMRVGYEEGVQIANEIGLTHVNAQAAS